MTDHFRIVSALCLATIVALAGCTTTGADDPADSGSASIYIKDAPTDEFDEIHVIFTAVTIHASGDDESDGWITLFQNETGADIDLLATAGDLAAFLGETELDAGNYTQIRIEIQRAYGVADGEATNITVSSGTLKVVGSFSVVADEETRITVDIDLDQSIKQQGNGAWRMTPVVGKTQVEIVEDTESGEDVDEEGEIVPTESE